MAVNFLDKAMDQSVIKSIQGGCHKAFGEVYDVYAAPLLGIITKITAIPLMLSNCLICLIRNLVVAITFFPLKNLLWHYEI